MAVSPNASNGEPVEVETTNHREFRARPAVNLCDRSRGSHLGRLNNASPEFRAIVSRVASRKRTISCQSLPGLRIRRHQLALNVSVTARAEADIVLSRRTCRAPRTDTATNRPLRIRRRFERAQLERANTRHAVNVPSGKITTDVPLRSAVFTASACRIRACGSLRSNTNWSARPASVPITASPPTLAPWPRSALRRHKRQHHQTSSNWNGRRKNPRPRLRVLCCSVSPPRFRPPARRPLPTSMRAPRRTRFTERRWSRVSAQSAHGRSEPPRNG